MTIDSATTVDSVAAVGVATRAFSADAALLPRLATGLCGRVHSVFTRVVNVEVDDGELVTLASRDVDDAPDTVVVDIGGFDGTGIRRGTPFASNAAKLHVGTFEFAFDGVRRWTATLPAYPQDTAALRANLAFVATSLERGGARFARPLRATADDFARDAALALAHHTQRLLDALARHDVARAASAAHAMVGLGPGLTPSGDDWLVGLFATLNVPGSPYGAMRGIGRTIVETARARTNAISFAALANAARGRVRESIATLLHTLIDATPQRVAPALERVLAIGSSSGREIAAGLAAGLALGVAP